MVAAFVLIFQAKNIYKYRKYAALSMSLTGNNKHFANARRLALHMPMSK